MNRIVELLKRIEEDPFNEVSAISLPDGGVEIMLSHRIGMDEAVAIRVRTDEDIRFYNRPEDEEALERTNLGGQW